MRNGLKGVYPDSVGTSGGKKTILAGVVCGILVLWLAVGVWAKGAGTTGAAFLKIGASARAVGMGGAFCAIANDVDAINWNPGGLGQLSGIQATVMHNEWLEGIRYEYFGYAQNLKKIGTLGVGISYLSSGDIPEIGYEDGKITGLDEAGNPIDYFHAGDAALTLAYGRKLGEKLGLGCNLKCIYQTISNSTAWGGAVDIGALYAIKDLTIGMALQNLGPEITFEDEGNLPPMNLKLGCAYKLLGDSLLTDLDLNYQLIEQTYGAQVGIEWTLMKLIALRIGYGYNNAIEGLGSLVGLSAGMGFAYQMGKVSLGVNYAWVPYGELSEKTGGTHRLSLITKF